jgi:hypothetical protein
LKYDACKLIISDPDSINPDTFVHERKPFYLRMRYQITKKNSKTKHSGYLVYLFEYLMKIVNNRIYFKYLSSGTVPRHRIIMNIVVLTVV